MKPSGADGSNPPKAEAAGPAPSSMQLPPGTESCLLMFAMASGLNGKQPAAFVEQVKSAHAAGQLPPMPAELTAAVAHMQSLIEACKAKAQRPELQAELRRFQQAAAALDPKDPLYREKLAKIPRPDMDLPPMNTAHMVMVRNWLAPTPFGFILRLVQQAGQTQQGQPAQQAQQPGKGTKASGKAQPPGARGTKAKKKPQSQGPPLPVAAGKQAAEGAASTAGTAGTAGAAGVAGTTVTPPAPSTKIPRKPVKAPPRASPPPPSSSVAAAGGAGSDGSGGGAGDAPHEVDVVCNGLSGTFLVDRQMMACRCAQCRAEAAKQGLRRFVVSPSEFERHAGMGQAKKWKWTVHTADNKLTIGDWLTQHNLDGPRKLGRSPAAAKKRKEEQQAEEQEASRQLAHGQQQEAGSGLGKRKRVEGEEMQDVEVKAQRRRESSPTPSADIERAPADASPELAQQGGGRNAANAQAAQAATTTGSGGHGRRHLPLRWIRNTSVESEAEGEEEAEEEDYLIQGDEDEEEEEQRSGRGAPHMRSLAELQSGAAAAPLQHSAAAAPNRQAPELLPLRRAAAMAAAAAERAAGGRQAGVAGSAVGPRLLGPPAVANGHKLEPEQQPGEGGRGPPGLRSPTGTPWMQADHAMHEEHEGTDMRLGKEYQAEIPQHTGPPPAGGATAEARERLAAQSRSTEAEALASAAGPEKDRAASMPQDAVADTWLREVADHMRTIVTGRQPRQRKQSRWLAETIDPNAVLGGKSLVEREFNEDDARDRFMLGKQSRASQERLSSELEVAAASGANPELVKWRVERYTDGTVGVEVRLSLGGVLLEGTLMPRSSAAAAAAGARLAGAGPAAPAVSRGREGDDGGSHAALPSVSGVSRGSGRDLDTPRTGSGALAGRAGAADGPGAAGGAVGLPSKLGPGAAAAAAAAVAGGGQSHLEGDSKPEGDAEQQAAGEARFLRLEAEGAPKGTKCTLCRLTDTDDIPEAERGMNGRSMRGLGQMMLVRMSTVAHAWVHDQCARWSPEVHDPEGTGRLVNLRDAVRRGRMLRCKYCGEKGATLGCLKRTCRASYHVACARKHNCLMQVDPYVVACPEHVDDLPPPFGAPKRAGMPRGGGGGRGKSRGRGTGGRGGRGGGTAGDGEAGSSSEDDSSDEREAAAAEVKVEVVPDAAAGHTAPQAEVGERPGQADEQEEKPAAQQAQRPAAAGAAAAPALGNTHALLARLSAMATQVDAHRPSKPAPPPPVPASVLVAAPPAGLPLPFPVIPGLAVPIVAWTRERIVEGPQLRSELLAEVTHGTRAVVVNHEGEHFRFRAFHNAADVTEAVQADSDAILVLDQALVPASADWPNTKSFPALTPRALADAFANWLINRFMRK